MELGESGCTIAIKFSAYCNSQKSPFEVGRSCCENGSVSFTKKGLEEKLDRNKAPVRLWKKSEDE
jgi:hypothetical protein